MARHVLTLEQRIEGLEKALASRRTPRRLRPNMRLYLEELKAIERGDHAEAQRLREERRELRRRRRKMKAVRKGG
jgi:uncharacterized membrane protein (DUF106 family)